MMPLHDTLIQYTILPSNEKPESVWVMELVSNFGLRMVLREIEKILASDSREDIRNVLTFMRDATIFPREHPDFTQTVQSFRDEIPKSKILTLMYQNLTSPQMLIRDWTVYTLGKMGFEGSGKELRKVLPQYIEETPEVVSRLLFEIFWLEDRDYDLLKQLASLHNPKVSQAIKEYFEICIIDDPIEIQKRDEILVHLI